MLLLLSLGLPALAGPLQGKAYVIDADTLAIGRQKIRLAHVDGLERGQTCRRRDGSNWACGETSAEALRRHIGDAIVRCEPQGKSYDRIVARCTLDGEDLGRWLVQQGWALASTYRTRAYVDDQKQAKLKSRGIWATEFVPPREWRKQHPPAAPKP